MEVTRAALAASSSRAQRRDPVLPTCIVELVLLTDRSRTEPRLELRFIGAVEVRIGHLDRMDGFRLDVRDIGHWQRERIRFEVVDDESQLLSLQCVDFEFLLIGYAEGTIN
ncbi:MULTISPECIES: hypothetical protein [unclassified Bradyrhizobium]|uniref:hypothetical protein n=1 Tax=unclassified Bradyrhizobium TaxID=2631580 RepID=UPI002915F561|nr:MULTISPECIES: hypothetical protein [unclassified Bradyrhizobium]